MGTMAVTGRLDSRCISFPDGVAAAFLRQKALQLGGIEVVGALVDVHKHRLPARLRDRLGGRNKCIGRGDDQVAVFHS